VPSARPQPSVGLGRGRVCCNTKCCGGGGPLGGPLPFPGGTTASVPVLVRCFPRRLLSGAVTPRRRRRRDNLVLALASLLALASSLLVRSVVQPRLHSVPHPRSRHSGREAEGKLPWGTAASAVLVLPEIDSPTFLASPKTTARSKRRKKTTPPPTPLTFARGRRERRVGRSRRRLDDFAIATLPSPAHEGRKNTKKKEAQREVEPQRVAKSAQGRDRSSNMCCRGVP
jgi:hypothetical protein